MQCLDKQNTKSSIEKLRLVMSTSTFTLPYPETQTTKKSDKLCVSYGKALITFGLFCLTLSGLNTPLAFSQVADSQAILAIVGEAENQGLTGMTAIGEAIRNRGTLSGVYGLKSPRVKKAPKWVFAMAREAWEASETSNLVKGAQFWESTDFKTPYWAKGMIETAHIGKHKFYREVKK